MAREKQKTLTEQMYYILLSLWEERNGVQIMKAVSDLTDERIKIGPGTLYALLADFAESGLIKETSANGKKKSYIITDAGKIRMAKDVGRIFRQIKDYEEVSGSYIMH